MGEGEELMGREKPKIFDLNDNSIFIKGWEILDIFILWT